MVAATVIILSILYAAFGLFYVRGTLKLMGEKPSVLIVDILIGLFIIPAMFVDLLQKFMRWVRREKTLKFDE